jgi:hypothetical protein
VRFGRFNRSARRWKVKFKGERVDLTQRFGWTTNEGLPLWMEIPLGVTEGLIYDMGEIRKPNADGSEQDPGSRKSNLLLLDKVIAWNFDGPDGKPLKLPSAAKTEKERLDILAQMPIDVFKVLAEKMLNAPDLSEKAEDFSKTSSAES